MANTFSRWVPVSFPLFDTEAKLKLRAFNKREAPEFKASVAARFKGMERKDGESAADHEARTDRLLEEWLALSKNTFSKWVRLAEPLKDEESQTEITTGAQLYEEAPGDFVMRVMLKLGELASLGDTEGKSSGSPSTSTVEAGQPSSEDPANTTEESASPKLSIAPAPITSIPVPFLRQA